MEILSLDRLPLAQVVTAFSAAFADYRVAMPTDVGYWKERFKGARVDWQLSLGAFDGAQLVAFILLCVDDFHGFRTAFNTGTGVLPAYRGRALVDALYAQALPQLLAAGVQRCALDVITTNAQAIRVYERIGFQTARELLCFKGPLAGNVDRLLLEPVSVATVMAADLPGREWDSWDNTDSALIAGGAAVEAYRVLYDGQLIGYLGVNVATGNVLRVELVAGAPIDYWGLLLAALGQVQDVARIYNIDARRSQMVAQLQQHGLPNVINQYEMTMVIV